MPTEQQYDGYDGLIAAGKQADAVVVATMVSYISALFHTPIPLHWLCSPSTTLMLRPTCLAFRAPLPQVGI